MLFSDYKAYIMELKEKYTDDLIKIFRDEHNWEPSEEELVEMQDDILKFAQFTVDMYFQSKRNRSSVVKSTKK